jgi:RHS repeat-associated protein
MYDGTAQHASLTHKLPGKERDSESGLDNFGARYMGSSLGRFMSPDPENVGAYETDPQSWNGYAYARNNPLSFIDPTGLAYCQWSVSSSGAEDRDNCHENGGASQGECGDQDGKWIQEAGDPQLVRNDSGDTAVISTPGTTVTVNEETGYVDTVSYGGGEIVQPDQPPTDQQKLLTLKLAGLEAEYDLGCVAIPGAGLLAGGTHSIWDNLCPARSRS